MATSNAGWVCVVRGPRAHNDGELTVDHVFDGLLIILTQVDDTGFGLAELATASSIKEA